MLDKELKHRPFVCKCREINASEVQTQTIFLLIHTSKKIIDHFCPGFFNYCTTEYKAKTNPKTSFYWLYLISLVSLTLSNFIDFLYLYENKPKY